MQPGGSGACHGQAVSVGWLELEQVFWNTLRAWVIVGVARDLGPAGMALAGWLEHVDWVPTCTIKV